MAGDKAQAKEYCEDKGNRICRRCVAACIAAVAVFVTFLHVNYGGSLAAFGRWNRDSAGRLLLAPFAFDPGTVPSYGMHMSADQRMETRLVAFIPSPMEWRDRRERLSKTFLLQQWAPRDVHIIYVLGTRTGRMLEVPLDTSVMDEEVATFRRPNLHFLFTPCRDRGDEFDNPNGTSSTTCKTYHGLVYASRMYDCEYVWRAADDAYLNLHFFFSTVVHGLEERRVAASSAGDSLQKRIPVYMGSLRDAARHDAEDLNLDRQPLLQQHVWRVPAFGSYMSGMSFMVTKDVADLVAGWTIPPQDTWCEDVMVGAWLMPFKIQWLDANEQGWNMINRQDWTREKCMVQLVVHYVQDTDWQAIDNETGSMQFCM